MAVARHRQESVAPYSIAECAAWMGVSTSYLRDCVAAGELKAEKIVRPGKRPIYRVHETDFVAFLKLIRFHRLPHASTRAEGAQHGR